MEATIGLRYCWKMSGVVTTQRDILGSFQRHLLWREGMGREQSWKAIRSLWGWQWWTNVVSKRILLVMKKRIEPKKRSKREAQVSPGTMKSCGNGSTFNSRWRLGRGLTSVPGEDPEFSRLNQDRWVSPGERWGRGSECEHSTLKGQDRRYQLALYLLDGIRQTDVGSRRNSRSRC